MNQSIVHIALVVRDYDEAIAFCTQKLNFVLLEDTYQAEQNKRWVLIAPPSPDSSRTSILLAGDYPLWEGDKFFLESCRTKMANWSLGTSRDD